MEFHQKLQELRKQKGITQEELSQALYVSRTAVSKWESGRGYPNIDSLKAIAKFFSVTVDELLSGEEVLNIAEEDHKEKKRHICDLIFGLLDLSVVSFLFLPLFGQKTEEMIRSVSLLSLTGVAPWLRIAYFAVVLAITAMGIVMLTLQNCSGIFWKKYKNTISLLLNIAGVLLLILSTQPYGAILLLVFFVIKLIVKNKL